MEKLWKNRKSKGNQEEIGWRNRGGTMGPNTVDWSILFEQEVLVLGAPMKDKQLFKIQQDIQNPLEYILEPL